MSVSVSVGDGLSVSVVSVSVGVGLGSTTTIRTQGPPSRSSVPGATSVRVSAGAGDAVPSGPPSGGGGEASGADAASL